MASSADSAPSSSPFETLFGPTLQTKDSSETPTSTCLTGKVVGIYFSAHWCPPCRSFTPQLAKTYQAIKKAGKAFEIVFVSSDRDQSSFDEYFGEMPWTALPFSNRDAKAALSKKFRVSGIPTLVLLDENGNTLTTDGRSVMASDPTGEQYPWKPKSVEELLGDTLVGKNGNVPMSDVKGKKIALYFSAHWCPPCRAFTPELAKTYTAMKESGRSDMEFIFVSSDRDQSSFDEYHGEMPWLALPFDKRGEKEALSRKFGVQGIPTLITLDENFEVINKSARGAVSSDPKGEKFPWQPEPVDELSATVESNGLDVNEATAIVAVTTGLDAAEQERIKADLTAVAKDVVAKAKASKDDPEFIFFTASSKSGPVTQVMQLAGIDEGFAPGFLILDIPDNGGYYTTKPASVDAESMRALMADYKAGKLDRKQMS